MRRLRNAQAWPWPLLPPPASAVALPPSAPPNERSELKDVRFMIAACRLADAAAAQQRRACASGAGGGRLQLLRRTCGAMPLQGDRERNSKGEGRP